MIVWNLTCDHQRNEHHYFDRYCHDNQHLTRRLTSAGRLCWRYGLWCCWAATCWGGECMIWPLTKLAWSSLVTIMMMVTMHCNDGDDDDYGEKESHLWGKQERWLQAEAAGTGWETDQADILWPGRYIQIIKIITVARFLIHQILFNICILVVPFLCLLLLCYVTISKT